MHTREEVAYDDVRLEQLLAELDPKQAHAARIVLAVVQSHTDAEVARVKWEADQKIAQLERELGEARALLKRETKREAKKQVSREVKRSAEECQQKCSRHWLSISLTIAKGAIVAFLFVDSHMGWGILTFCSAQVMYFIKTYWSTIEMFVYVGLLCHKWVLWLIRKIGRGVICCVGALASVILVRFQNALARLKANKGESLKPMPTKLRGRRTQIKIYKALAGIFDTEETAIEGLMESGP